MATLEENREGIVVTGKLEDKLFDFDQQHEAEFPCVIPASCNWYSPSIISCYRGYCALGGKNAVFMLTLKKHPPVYEWDMNVSIKISVKVTSLAIIGTEKDNSSPYFPELIAVGLEDGLSRIIDTKSKTMVKEHRKHKCKIAAVSWSHVTPKVILTGDIKGNISVWDYAENLIQMWTPIPTQIICLQMSPIKYAFFVVGYQNGNIIVGDADKLVVILTLKSHIDDVTSLSWCPVSRDGTFCFASASKDGTIRLWEVTNDKSFRMLTPTKRTYGKKKEASRQNFFHAVLWLNEMQIVSGMHNGDLICWDTDGKSNIIGCAHDRIIFTMSCDVLTNQFVTVSMDRNVIVWNGRRICPTFKIPSFGGFIYSLSTSLNNPYTVAIGVGDNTIRILSIDDSNPGYDCMNLWDGIKSKVTVLALHPMYEAIVGYATEGGRVGCFSMNSKRSDISLSYHKKSVYSLAWAPSYLSEDFSSEVVKINCLYTVGGEGTVLMHKMGAFGNAACDLGKLIKTRNNLENSPARSDIAWMVDYTYFALSNGDGTIDLFKTTSLNLLCSVNCHKKMVNCMAWHHNYSHIQGGVLYANWLASGSNEDVLCITDFSVAITNSCNETKETLEPYKVTKLHGHSSRITRLVWNPHKNAILASSSFDGSVRIWDVEENTTLATFCGHIGRVYSVVWSYLDGDVVYSGGEDFTLRRWKISQLSDDTSTGRKKKTRKKKSNQEKYIDVIEGVTVQSNEDVTSSPTTDLSVPQKKQDISVSPEITMNTVPRESKSEGSRKKKVRSLLKKVSAADGKTKELMQQDCVSLARYLKACSEDETTCKEKSGVDPTLEENINLSLYTTRGDAYSLLSTECCSHEENQSHDQVFQLEMWRNNIGGLLDKAVKQSSMNDTLVALAPLGGYDMWKAALAAYAEQLEKLKKFHTAAVYYLATGNVYKAVNVLKENGYHREALVLAKVQLGCDDPIIKEIYISRGRKLSDECQFEHAAENFLAAGCIDDAITILAKRGDAASLLTSLKVADIYNVKKQSSYLLCQTCSALFQEQKWTTLHNLLTRYSKVELIHLQAVVGEFLVDSMFETDLVKSLSIDIEHHKKFKHFTENQQTDPSYINHATSSTCVTPSFLMMVLHVFDDSYNFSRETCIDFEHIDFQQLQCSRSHVVHRNITELWSEVVNSVLYGIIYLLKGDCANCFKNWLSALAVIECSGYPVSLISLFDVLFPKHYVSFYEITQLFYSVECDHLSYITSFTNFFAFKCSGILYRMWYKISNNSLLKGSVMNVIEPDKSNIQANHSDNTSCKSMSYDCYCVEKDFYFCLSWLSSLLTSSPHASCVLLQSEIRSIDERLMELDIKKRLNQHILSRKQVTSCITTVVEEEEDILSEVNKLCNQMVSVVIKIETSSTADVCNQSAKLGDIQEHLENEMLVGYLSRKKHDLSETLRLFPSEVNEFAFPQTTVLFQVLLLLCFTNEASDERVTILGHDIATWGKHHKVYPSRYVERLMIQKHMDI